MNKFLEKNIDFFVSLQKVFEILIGIISTFIINFFTTINNKEIYLFIFIISYLIGSAALYFLYKPIYQNINEAKLKPLYEKISNLEQEIEQLKNESLSSINKVQSVITKLHMSITDPKEINFSVVQKSLITSNTVLSQLKGFSEKCGTKKIH